MKTASIVAKRCAGLLAILFRAYSATLRIRILLLDGTVVHLDGYHLGRVFLALSERDSLALAVLAAKVRLTVLVTKGRDGDWVAAVLERLGCCVVRGSSLAGGTRALKDLFFRSRKVAGSTAIVVDGPLGPVGRAKGGIVLCGIYTECPVRGLGVAASHRWTFSKSWSKIYLPLPFSRVVVAVDGPLPGLEAAGVDDVDDLAHVLSRRVAAMQDRAAAEVLRSKNFGRRRGHARGAALDRLHESEQP